MKLAVLFSGGKDSHFAMHLARKEHTISCLIHIKSKNDYSYMFQSAGCELVILQAQALNLPILIQETLGEKEKELDDLKILLNTAKKQFGIEGIVTGAIASTYQASRIQKLCNELKLWCFNPLWQITQEQYIKTLLKEKFSIILSGIATYPLTSHYLGKKITTKLASELLTLANKYKISPIGEGGEFESLVLDSPMHIKKIKILKKKVIMDSEYSGKLIITDAKVIDK
jgi:diphthine-ammonia ligase